ncbi:MAG: hypothetical protein COB26_02095 [Piscirickettsiaceae bacterium]|nr:MAG: hypothetical protein COB26_02095 [Piscirickettsiaceae bacterium]
MKIIRVLVLLSLLAFVAFYSKLQRLDTTSWTSSLQVSIYPINGDGSEFVKQYVQSLTVSSFKGIETFLDAQHKNYNELSDKTVNISLQDRVIEEPPVPPKSGNVVAIMYWSLQMRWWSYQQAVDSDRAQVNMYVIYYEPKEGIHLAHSLGLQKGLIGVVNAFASTDNSKQNNIVIAHELLHTVGATDKYSMATGQPIYPIGYARPELKFDQSKAEIMAGKIPITESESDMPYSLMSCMVGELTANEIGWVRKY